MSRPRDADGNLADPRDVLDAEELEAYAHGKTTPGRGPSADEPDTLARLIALQQKQREGTS